MKTGSNLQRNDRDDGERIGWPLLIVIGAGLLLAVFGLLS